MFKPVASLRKSLQPLDRAAILLILLLSLLIGGLVLKGDRTAPRVREFTWQNRQVGAEDTAFVLTFSRPMDQTSVEQNLRIDPPVPGKVSWAGRRMAYTLNTPAPYGKTFRLELQGARDRFSKAEDARSQMQPFTGEFRTRDRAFIYLGVEGAEAGRLVLQNLTTQQQQVLTPENLVVMDFKPYPEGDRILFSAIERAPASGLLDQQLYTVTTGIQIQATASTPGISSAPDIAPRPAQPAKIVELILDNKEFQNLKFDLSPDGQSIIVQRVNRQDLGQFGLWLLKPGAPPTPIKTEPGGDFIITPDSAGLAMSQGQGMAILPLAETAEALDFLPKFGVVLTFARDGSAAAMVKFNTDPTNPTRSLFLVNNQGTDKELLKTDGAILSAQFDPTKQNLYCLITRRIPGDVYQEQPYLTAIHLPTSEVIDLLQLPLQRDVQMSLSPDGLGILFDQATDAADAKEDGAVRGSDGKAIATSKLWFVPVLQDEQGKPLAAEPQEVGLMGLRPRWLP
ncbi:MAG: Ig-like domain-containing protein [Oscillatoriophycideae cyanobacterium NC_groundwater_1537_Pr4_S-0.65um_50_18]|nr:Ig-like domain-containing protein [Oscillatoriophycideae cyanobacterium NC_groundwater_1537_Pr4_S-0.65um_50_18]